MYGCGCMSKNIRTSKSKNKTNKSNSKLNEEVNDFGVGCSISGVGEDIITSLLANQCVNKLSKNHHTTSRTNKDDNNNDNDSDNDNDNDNADVNDMASILRNIVHDFHTEHANHSKQYKSDVGIIAVRLSSNKQYDSIKQLSQSQSQPMSESSSLSVSESKSNSTDSFNISTTPDNYNIEFCSIHSGSSQFAVAYCYQNLQTGKITGKSFISQSSINATDTQNMKHNINDDNSNDMENKSRSESNRIDNDEIHNSDDSDDDDSTNKLNDSVVFGARFSF